MADDLHDPLSATHESTVLVFKREFDPSVASEWCELIKDIVAMANSGGGVILIGVNDNGTVSGCDVARY